MIMPSVSIKPQENGALQAPETSIQAAIAIVEKKVRNLEKRKGKLDAYRDTLRKGKALNEDQQSAVDKYEEVIGTLEFTKELMGQFGKLSQDEVRDKKKQAKKDLLERSKEDISKVAYVLAVKEILTSLQEESVIADLKAGSDGAPKLTAEQVEQLAQLTALVTPDREIKEKGSFDKQVNISAEHLTNLADKKTRTVAGSTYQELHALINLIRESGYIESKWAKDSATNTEADNDMAAEDDYDTQDTQDTQDEDEDTMPATEPIIKPEMTNGNGSIHETNDRLGHNNSEEQPQEPLPVFPSPPQQQPQQHVVASPPQQGQHQHPSPPQQIQQQQPAAPMPEPPSFNFLQESQIDLESPHMDPAVVMVHHGQRPPVPGTVPAHPPGMAGGTVECVEYSRQMLQQLHIQQQHALMAQHHQHQPGAPLPAVASAGDRNSPQAKFNPSHNSAFDKPGQGQPHAPGLANGLSGPCAAGGPPFSQTSPADRPAPSTDPRAPRVPDGTPQHTEQLQPSPNKVHTYNQAPGQPTNSPPSAPAGYAAAAGGSAKVPDSEIGTWRPEGAPEAEEGDEDGRQGGDKGRRGRGGGGSGRGFGGRGNNRGYSRGRGGGGDRGDRSERGERGERGGYRGGRGGERRQYDDRREDRRDDRPRGGSSGRGGYRGRGGPRGGGGQNGYRE